MLLTKKNGKKIRIKRTRGLAHIAVADLEDIREEHNELVSFFKQVKKRIKCSYSSKYQDNRKPTGGCTFCEDK